MRRNRCLVPLLLCTTVLLCNIKRSKGEHSQRKQDLRKRALRHLQQQNVTTNATLTFEDLGIETEQDGLDICDMILDMFQTPIRIATAAIIPIHYRCGCNVYIEDLAIDFTCGVEICADVIGNLILNVLYPGAGLAVSALFQALPFKNLFCFRPSYTGTLGWGPRLGSEVCTGFSSVLVDAARLREMTYGVIDARDDFYIGVPNLCIGVDHDPSNFGQLESCRARVGRFRIDDTDNEEMVDCPCEVCNGGTDIRLECPDVMESILPPILRGVFEFTPQCMGIGAITGFGKDEDPVVPLVSPVLTMMKNKHTERTVGTVDRWFLVNAHTNRFVRYLDEEENTIDFVTLGTPYVNICVETRGDVASVGLSLNGLTPVVDNTIPYCLAADDATRGTFETVPYFAIPQQRFELQATPYLYDDAVGMGGNSSAISLTVLDSSANSITLLDTSLIDTTQIRQWNLVDTLKSMYVRKLKPVNDLTQRAFGNQLSVCIDTPVTIQSVLFAINGREFFFDKVRPFCLAGNDATKGTFHSVRELGTTGGFLITATTFRALDRAHPTSVESITINIDE